ncbi:MAG TPA: peptidoglycan DD-metalloendopeptidase family protein [Candidatus Manganitrophaceae bacterium]|nr:peptidoglycan DD-metalloendopeptidase family protein [Candidatus Manganitrophaceae bacterium]
MKNVKWVLILSVVALYFGGRWWFDSPSPAEETVPQNNGAPAVEAVSSLPPSPSIVPAVENKQRVKEHTFKVGDSLFAVLGVLGVPNEEIYDIFQSAKKIYDLRKIIPGQKIKIFLQETPKKVGALLYEISPMRSLRMERSEDGFHAVEEKAVVDQAIESRGGEISDTLFDSARRAGVQAEVILDLADIFAWDLDFSTEIQPGDHFRVVYEVFKHQGEIFKTGRILAAEMINQGRIYKAYHFAQAGEKGAYYDGEGHSLKKAFLKSPLRYRYISSGFSASRLHPILKVSRPHLGIDYAAQYGTPVMAASGGTVTFVGWQGGHGKTVIVRHRNGYSTLYGHLSAYGDGIRVGKKIDQSDIVGRVGSTGLSTGPHLHYTLMKNGKAIDPKNADVVRGDPLSKDSIASFAEQVQRMDAYFASPERPEKNSRM